MITFPSLNEQMELIRKGAEEILPEEEMVRKIEQSIKTHTPMRIKLGADPSRPDLHIGHGVVLNKLRNFQDLGHQAVLIIGDFTAMIGDPSGKSKTRPALTLEETKENAQSYFDQAGIILDTQRLEIHYNSDWLNKLTFEDVIVLSSKYTVARMLERDDFAKRYKEGMPISVHEFMYPLAQAYDSYAIRADVEIGGTDQKFNFLVARDIQREYGQNPQVILTMPILEGTDGVEKMSKSLGNYIALTDPPEEMYGKTLSIPDELILRYYVLTTDLSPWEIEKIKKDLATGKNPRDAKHDLAWHLVRRYHSKEDADKARDHFNQVFVKGGVPDEMEEYTVSPNERIMDILVEAGQVSSSGEAKRLMKQGGVSLDGEKITDIQAVPLMKGEAVLKIGKRKFLKLKKK
ncbi:MAG: tyrosyl-tRNA synthetase [Candidatus Marinimicrobia bacterium]|jgi:tyrosyl-tRNA synthetase|nr:tyrosyl-tRNA synthetase [Candidatus Neomarinimicrobiota bacterium]